MAGFPPYDELDKNADGELTYGELEALRQRKILPKVLLGALADRNGDDIVSREEYAALEAQYGGMPDIG